MPDDRVLGVRHGKTVEKFRIDDGAVADKGFVCDTERLCIGIGRADHRNNGQAVLAGKVEVALIVGGTAENSPGAVIHQDEIGDIDGQRFAVDDRMGAFQAGIETELFRRLDGRFRCCHAVARGNEFGQSGIVGGQFLGQRVVR